MTWRELRDEAAARLTEAGVASPDAEARWIVESASGRQGAELLSAEHERAPATAAGHVVQMVQRRSAGEPLQYVLGAWQFRGIDLHVDSRVLIPRPETEITAQVAIDAAVSLGARRGRHGAWSGGEAGFVAVDLGTGSGALACALATELSDVEVWATDASSDALAVARANLSSIGSAATRVRLADGDWFDALPSGLRGRIDLAVSNPPYVAEGELDELAPEVVEHEPRTALVSGPTGLEAIGQIVEDAPRWLDRPGVLVVEIAPHQAGAVRELARHVGFAAVTIERDLAARDRVMVAHLA